MRLARATACVVVLPALLLWPTLGPARAETLSIGVTEPAPATLTGELSIPRGTGPFPAVILLHGCGGVTANVKEWATWLRYEGYAAFVLDSFRGRGLRRLCGGSAALTGRMRAPDVFAAAAHLKTVPQVDPSRLAAIGFSHGGWAVLWAATSEARYPDARLRAFIAFYPPCTGRKTLPGTTPVLMLLGGQDDWAPAAPCEELARAAARAGRDVTAVVYPSARHHFDGAELKRRIMVPDARGGRGATIQYDPRAHEDAEKQVRAFLEANLRK